MPLDSLVLLARLNLLCLMRLLCILDLLCLPDHLDFQELQRLMSLSNLLGNWVSKVH